MKRALAVALPIAAAVIATLLARPGPPAPVPTTAAQDPAPQPPVAHVDPAAPERCPLSVHLRDGEGRPLGGGLVSVGEQAAETGRDGEATFGHVAPGPGRVTAVHAGHAPAEREAMVACGGRLDLTLLRGARLAVSVRDAAGPVENVVVLVSAASARLTGRDGRCTFEDLAPGLHHVRVQAAGAASAWDYVSLAEGEAASLDVELLPAMPVAGRVVDARGQPVPGAEVEARAFEGEAPELATITGTDGAFAFTALAAGAWSIAARAAGHGPSRPVRVERAAADLVLRLRAGASVLGRVEVDGAAATGVTVNGRRQERDGELLVQDLPPGRVRLEVRADGAPARDIDLELAEGERRDLGTLSLARGARVEGRLIGPGGEPVDGMVQVAGHAPAPSAGGAFVLDGLAPGRLTVQAMSPGLAPGAAIVEARAGETTRVDLRLDGGARIRVLLLAAAGVPAPGAAVSLVDGADGTELLRTRTGPDGRASSEPLGPGRYAVLAELGGHREVHPLALGRADVELTLGPPATGATVHVAVRGRGAPSRVASVMLAPGRPGPPRAAADVLRLMSTPGLLLAAPRTARFAGVPPGPHTAIALVEGPARGEVRAASAPVDVPAYGEVEVALEVAADAAPFVLAGTP